MDEREAGGGEMVREVWRAGLWDQLEPDHRAGDTSPPPAASLQQVRRD